jgi:hypothetical protein
MVLASVGVAALLLGGAIASRGPAVDHAPDEPATSLGMGLVAGGSDGGMVEYNEKGAASKKARRHRFHQPHELPDESLPPPSGSGQRDQRD